MDLAVVRTPSIVAAEINSIKEQTQKIMLFNSIEIGRRLVEAKSLLEHGEWGKWLKESVDYSQSTANNMMRIFEEYGANQTALFGDNAKSQALGNLAYTQAVALLGVPESVRESFVEENNVAEMSTRELQQAIKDLKAAEARAKAAETENQGVQEENIELRDSNKKMAKELAELKKKAKALEKELKAGNDAEDADREGEQAQQLAEAQAKIDELTAKLAEPVTIEPAVVEKVPDEVQAELAELRAKAAELEAKQASMTAAEAARLKFKVQFDVLTADFKALLAALGEIKANDNGETHEKYRKAVFGLMEKMKETV